MTMRENPVDGIKCGNPNLVEVGKFSNAVVKKYFFRYLFWGWVCTVVNVDLWMLEANKIWISKAHDRRPNMTEILVQQKQSELHKTLRRLWMKTADCTMEPACFPTVQLLHSTNTVVLQRASGEGTKDTMDAMGTTGVVSGTRRPRRPWNLSGVDRVGAPATTHEPSKKLRSIWQWMAMVMKPLGIVMENYNDLSMHISIV